MTQIQVFGSNFRASFRICFARTLYIFKIQKTDYKRFCLHRSIAFDMLTTSCLNDTLPFVTRYHIQFSHKTQQPLHPRSLTATARNTTQPKHKFRPPPPGTIHPPLAPHVKRKRASQRSCQFWPCETGLLDPELCTKVGFEKTLLATCGRAGPPCMLAVASPHFVGTFSAAAAAAALLSTVKALFCGKKEGTGLNTRFLPLALKHVEGAAVGETTEQSMLESEDV